MAEQERESQPAELSTGERLATTGRAVAQGIAHRIKGEHETTGGAALTVQPGEAQRLIDSWPAPQRAVAEQMLSRYGDPNEATPTRLTWYRNGPWKRTEITSDVVEHHWPAPHSDFLTQTIDYRVPPERVSDVVAFDGSILVDRTKGEVSARCDSEAANVLGLNMVHEIATGRRTTDGARRISQENTVAYNLGRDAPYAERLLFEVPDGGTEDMDSSAVGGAIARQVAGKVVDATGHRSEPTDRRTP
jgi:hypothetical protein